MAGFIKGITIEFGADVSGLNSALKKTQGTKKIQVLPKCKLH